MNGSSLSAAVLLAVLTITSANTQVSGRTSSKNECPTGTGAENTHLPHESDCGLFYHCVHGSKVLKECAAGLHFNAALQVCDWPASAQCTLGGSDDTSSSQGSSSTTESSISGSSSTASETIISTECPTGPGSENVHLQHESDCSLFYHCSHGEKVLKECPTGLAFNAVLEICDWPEFAGCTLDNSGSSVASSSTTASSEASSSTTESSEASSSTTEASVGSSSTTEASEASSSTSGSSEVSSSTTEASETSSSTTETENTVLTECPTDDEGDNVHLAHESDCTLFYHCSHGEKIEKECPAGLHFNAVLQVCDWPDYAGCIAGETPGSDGSESGSSTTGSSDSGSSTESSSASTEAGVIIPTECPTDFEADNVHLAHESNCSLFYHCVFGEQVEKECPPGLHFNPTLQVCDWPESAGCTVGDTDDSEGSGDTDTTDGPTESSEAGSESTEDDNTTDGTIESTESSDDTDGSGASGEEENSEEDNEDGEIVGTTPAESSEWDSSGDTGTTEGTKESSEDGSETTESDDNIDGSTESTESTDNTDGSGASGEEENSEEDDTDAESTEAAVTIPTECPTGSDDSNVHIAHESDCSLFYHCSHGEMIEKECPAGLHFNAVLQVCDWPASAGCTATSDSDDSGSESSTTDSSDSGSSTDSSSDSTEAAVIIPTECPTDFEADNVHLAHESNCSLFYHCVFGEQVEKECPPGLHFNPTLQVCDWPESAGCTVGSTDDSEGSGDIGTTEDPTESSESGSESTEDDNTTDGTTVSTDSSDDTDGSEVSREEENSGEDNDDSEIDGTTPAESSEWDSGEWDNSGDVGTTEGTKESSEDASQTTESTDDTDGSGASGEEENSEEDDTDAESTEAAVTIPTECPIDSDDSNVHIAHESDCGLFYHCSHGEMIEKECPAGLHFNAVLQVCDWPASAGCTATSDSDDSGSESSTTGSSDSDSSTDSSSDSTEAAVIIPTECPTDSEADNVHLAHESNCSLFYHCVFGEQVVKECPPGLHFNPALQVCDWPESAGCTVGDTDDSEGSGDTDTTDGPTESSEAGSESTEDDNTTDGTIESTESSDDTDGSGASGEEENSEEDNEDSDIVGTTPAESSEWNSGEGDSSEDIGTTEGTEESSEDGSETTESDDNIDGSTESTENTDDTDGSGASGEEENSKEDNTDAVEVTTSSDSSNAESTEAAVTIPTECPIDSDDSNVHIAHESDCTLFYHCNHGEMIEKECPAGLHFNAVLQVCDWPASAGCTATSDSDDSGSESSTTGSSDSDSSTDSSSDSTEAAVIIPTECPADFEEDNVHLAHESDCTLFYQCVLGEQVVKECPPGLHFNPTLQVCDWPESAGCTADGTGDSEGSGNDNNNDDLGNTTPIDSSEWDSSEWNNNEDIDTTDDPVIGSTTGSNWDTDYNSTEIESTTIVVDRENCEHTESCPAEDPLDYTVLLAHIDCTKFCKCSNGVPYVYDCPPELYFNDELKVCDWTEASGCIQN